MLRSLSRSSVSSGAGVDAGRRGLRRRASQPSRNLRLAPRTIEVTGVIKSISWRNPHGQILLDVHERRRHRYRVGCRDRVDRRDAQPRRGAERRRRRRSRDDRGRAVGARPQRDPRAQHAALERLRVHVRRRAGATFPKASSGRIVGRATIEADVAAATAKADGIFRVWSTIMSDPAAFPMFKGGYPLTAAGAPGSRSGIRATTRCCTAARKARR